MSVWCCGVRRTYVCTQAHVAPSNAGPLAPEPSSAAVASTHVYARALQRFPSNCCEWCTTSAVSLSCLATQTWAHTHTHTHTHTCTLTHTYTHLHTHTHTHRHIQTQLCTHTHPHTHRCIFRHTHTHTHTHTHARLYT